MKTTVPSAFPILSILISAAANAQLPYESRAGGTDLKAANSKVETGVGNFFFSTSSNLGDVTINAFKYNLFIGDDIYAPFYIFVSKTVKSEITEATIVDQIQNDKGGVLNFKLANDMYKAQGFKGLCDFNTLKGGCYLSYNISFKVIEKLGSNAQESQYFPSWYAGLGLHLEFPIYPATGKEKTEIAGRLILGIEAAYTKLPINETQPNLTSKWVAQTPRSRAGSSGSQCRRLNR